MCIIIYIFYFKSIVSKGLFYATQKLRNYCAPVHLHWLASKKTQYPPKKNVSDCKDSRHSLASDEEEKRHEIGIRQCSAVCF